MGRSGVELAAAPIRAMSKASGLVFDHWAVLCAIFAALVLAFLVYAILWEVRETRRLEELCRQAQADRAEAQAPQEG